MPETAPRTKDHRLPPRSLDEIVEAFETAWNHDEQAEVEAFLPDAAHPHFAAVALELLAIDLERRWQRGDRPSLEAYLERFPRIISGGQLLEPLAFEQYRLLRSHGESARPEEFAARFHIDTSHWPRADSTHIDRATAVFSSRRTSPEGDELARDWEGPREGEAFLEFEILQPLGIGKFGRVYKARQARLAGRHVVLKITAQRWSESDRLARLQHAHIVPIHSVHQHGDLQVVCMPYFGRHTLDNVLRGLGPRDPCSAAEFVDRIVPDAGSGGELDDLSRVGAQRRSELKQLTFEQLAIALVAEVTSGLAHAHSRGILHRDLKPANILLTDDVQAMILDFNLSQSIEGSGSRSCLIGGTLPYMAPEHLRATDDRGQVDARGDVYAVGVILFEILTGQLPFTTERATSSEAIEAMVRQRWQQRPSARSINPRVSRAVDSIIRQCLAPDPARRYQSATELLEDLQCQRRDLPLKFAPERSWRERGRKWLRRHPRLTSAGGLAVIALGVVLVMAASLIWRGHRLAQLQALDQFHQFHELAREAVIPLCLPLADSPLRNYALDRGTAALALYAVDDPDWRSRSAYQCLNDDDREQLRSSLQELLYLMAWAKRRSAGEPEAQQQARLIEALKYNSIARQLGDSAEWVRVLERQAAELEDSLGRPRDEAARARLATAGQPAATRDTDDYFNAIQRVFTGQYADALPALKRYTENHPQNVLAWFLLGNCQFALGANHHAELSYTHCIAHWPETHVAYFQRGLTRLHQRRWDLAEADFTEALRRYPDPHAPLLNRAIARERQGRTQGAIDDYTALIQLGRDDALVYLLRSDAFFQIGDSEQGERDLQAGLRREPIDVDGWIRRGARRFAGGDPDGALADVEQALRLEPASPKALQQRAIILANAFERFGEAIHSLDHLLDLDPDHVNARMMRGLLRARMNDRDGAIDDAHKAMHSDSAALVFYQAAMIRATTSRIAGLNAVAVEEDAAEAVRLLADALGRDARLARDVSDEPELSPLLDRADLRRVLEAVDVLQQAEVALIKLKPTSPE